MTAATLTLTDFLLARITEDERDAIAIRDCERFNGVESDAEREICRLADPGRVLAECEAKRRILERHRPEVRNFNNAVTSDRVLRELATLYADHPDYREAWRP